MEFKVGDMVSVDGTRVIMLNCGRLFKVINIKPYGSINSFVEIENEFEKGVVNKSCLKIVQNRS